MKTDIEIAQEAQLKNITEVLPEYNDIIEPYGNHMAKISSEYIDENKVKNNKVILVTSMTPTKAGIGKTTVSIGLNDALRKIGKKSIAVLREPSLGPCFGMKGGACGGGYAQVVPMEKINLHFTGDFHAITSANNMIAAAFESYLYFHPEIESEIKNVTFKRCLDINDRSLRTVYTMNKDHTLQKRGFNITPASEIMAVFCLAKDIEDLRRRIDNIILAEYNDGTYFYASQLNITGSIIALLSEAFKPNLVQSLENNPVLIHGGPFANIAHGCNSVVATKLGLTLADYVVTEAGFGSDLGAEKYLDIKCRNNPELKPDVVVLTVTIPGLTQWNYHMGNLAGGFKNLIQHINALRSVNHNVVVTYNVHNDDNPEYVNKLIQFCEDHNVKCIPNTCYTDGGNGAVALAEEILSMINNVHTKTSVQYVYDLHDDPYVKIGKILKYIYGYRIADVKDMAELYHVINVSDNILRKFNHIMGNYTYSKYPICIAKTQYSLGDNPKSVPLAQENPNDKFTITDIEVNNGAEFIVLSAGKMVRMPGLPKDPAACHIDYVDGKITGLS